MAAILGRKGTIYVSDDDGSSYFEIGKLVDATLSMETEETDTTSHDSDGDRESLPNHRAKEISGNVIYDEASVGQDMLLDAQAVGTVLKVKYQPEDTTVGVREFISDCYVTSWEHGQPLEDSETMDFSLRFTGQLTIQDQT